MAAGKKINNEEKSSEKRTAPQTRKKRTTTPNRQTVRVAIQPEPEWEKEEDFVQSEAVILFSLAVALLLFLSNLHVCGPAGEIARNIQVGMFGTLGFALPFVFAGTVIFYSANQGNPIVRRKLVAGVILGIIICCFFQLFMGSEPGAGEGISIYYQKAVKNGVGGGMVGGLICMILKKILGGLGTFVLLFVCMIITIVCITERSFLRLVQEQGEMAWSDIERRKALQAERRQQRVRGVDMGAIDLASSRVSRGLRVYDGENQDGNEQNEADLEAKRAKAAGITLMNQNVGKRKQQTGGRNRRTAIQQSAYRKAGIGDDLIVGVPLGAPASALVPAKKAEADSNSETAEAKTIPFAEAVSRQASKAAEKEKETKEEKKVKEETKAEGKSAERSSLSVEASEKAKAEDTEKSGLKVSEPTITRPDPADIFTGSISHPQGYHVYTAEDERTSPNPVAFEQSWPVQPVKSVSPARSVNPVQSNPAQSVSQAQPVKTASSQPMDLEHETAAVQQPVRKNQGQEMPARQTSSQQDFFGDDELPFEDENEAEYGTAVLWSRHASRTEKRQTEAVNTEAVNTETVSTAAQYEPEESPVLENPPEIMANDSSSDVWVNVTSKNSRPQNVSPAGRNLRETLASRSGKSVRELHRPENENGYADRDVRVKPTENGGSFAVPSAERRVVTASGKVIETETESLHKKLESKRQEELRQARDAQELDTNVEREIRREEELPKPEYVFPPTTLLKRGVPSANIVSDQEYRDTAIKLQQTLRNFGVGVTVTNISCGPSVTRYELHPEQGVKVSKIVALADDIKLSLAAADIRIEAPIPGKSAVGIEVPNKENNTVYLRELLESESFQTHPSRLAFAVGKDIAGQVVVTDIAKMPHLLIAGATGSGKSVCINTLIMSVIFKSKPEDVKLIMIDPKVVELSVYNGIPHLLIPVVTDPKKASGALNWAVAEMTDRYKKFAQYNVRDLKGYNAKIESVRDLNDPNKPKKLPQIIIIVDELADLMMVAPGEVEDSICRLAQLARAAGIHLVIATQRPSVNVITGLIKANIPSRIAFSVSSGVDSRTIIDMNGAEKLLGKGDMLFYPAGFPKPQRVQGAFVSDQEVQAVVDFLTEQGMTADYRADIETQMNSAPSAGAGSARDARDEYFAEAGAFIIEKERASIGMLQRVFKIGFNRAARIMDQLAEAGVVGEEEGTKPRKILMTQQEFEELLRQ